MRIALRSESKEAQQEETMPRVWLCRWCHETVRETDDNYVVINEDTGETAHATCYENHHVTSAQEAEATFFKDAQVQVDRHKADLEARKATRKAFEETLIHQQNRRDEKSVESADDGRNAISAAGIEAFRRWFTNLPDDDPRVLRLLRALQRLDANPNKSMSPSVENLVGGFRFDNDAESIEAFLDRLTVAVEN
jgi:hypothetical protein